MNHLLKPVCALVMLLLVSTSITGCTSLAVTNWDWMSPKKFATAKKPVIEILALWEPAEGKGVDGMPTRGFSGQIMFFQHGNSSPVYAKGEVMIHLYDDQGDLKEQSKPLHQYKFESGAWQVHAADSTLGPSYQVFIPYVRKGRKQVECALRVQLSQENAPEIYSSMISVKLDGTTPKESKQTLAQQKPNAKSNVTVDTLARREAGKQLVISSEHQPSRQALPDTVQQEIQQVIAEVIEPVVDERDDRIRQLEAQMQSLLNAPKQQTVNSIRHSDFNARPTNSAAYRKFRLNGPQE